ncbi:MAG: HAMP domain-containing protein [Magnetococcales bacterium]|nr:HAMP domain-containing protein [Magnetococcales bacterium]
MKNPFPLGLTGRTLLLLLAGLFLSHAASILVFTSERLEPGVLTSEQQVLERMAAVIRLMVEIPPALHEPTLAAMNRVGMHFEALHEADPAPDALPPARDESLRRRLALAIDSEQARVAAVTVSEPDWNHPQGSWHRLLFAVEMGILRWMRGPVMDQELRAWVDLPAAGHRILLTTRPADHHAPLFRLATLSVLLMTGAIFLFSWLIARRMTLPLRQVVRAAEEIGRDVYAPPLPEEGPAEAAAVARALNRMNGRIRDFVEERLRMVAAISHDLRTPLTKLKLLVEFSGDDDARARMVGVLNEMESMLSGALAVARDAAAVEAKQRVNLTGLLSAICQDMADLGQPATFEEGPKQPCLCRPLAMKRALTNLIHNAVQHGGSTRVALRRQGDQLIIDIHDSGPGIPESQWENVFKPFFRLAPESDAGGAGLGLAIASSVIRDHHGTLGFVHPPESGFITRVELPVS